jgi:hypothetical protein
VGGKKHVETFIMDRREFLKTSVMAAKGSLLLPLLSEKPLLEKGSLLFLDLLRISRNPIN